MSLLEVHPINVLVEHSEPLLAAGLASSLRAVGGLHVMAPVVDTVSPSGMLVDVVVTDYQGGLDLMARQRQRQAGNLSHARVMVVAAQDRENDVRVAMERGVHGYLLMGCALQDVVAGVQALARGNRYLGMQVAQRMADSLTREALTAREFEVLSLLAHGDCNKTIARSLNIAIGTVKTHVKSIMGKLDAASRTQAVSIASRRGLVDAVERDVPLHMVMPFGMSGASVAQELTRYA